MNNSVHETWVNNIQKVHKCSPNELKTVKEFLHFTVLPNTKHICTIKFSWIKDIWVNAGIMCCEFYVSLTRWLVMTSACFRVLDQNRITSCRHMGFHPRSLTQITQNNSTCNFVMVTFFQEWLILSILTSD